MQCQTRAAITCMMGFMSRTLSNTFREGYSARGFTIPTLWLTTDTQRTPAPEAYVAHLPAGSGVILRHYGTPHRAHLATRLATVCKRRKVMLLVSEDWRLAAKVGAHGLHLPEMRARKGPSPGARLWLRRRKGLLTTAAHGPKALARASALKADAVFLSPIFATASHPERKALGSVRAALMAQGAGVAVIALGGVTAEKLAGLRALGFSGAAGIGLFDEGARPRW